MKKWIKRIIIGIVILVVAFLIVCVVEAFKDLKQEEILKQEIINFSNKNLETGNFTIKVKTTGDYAYVEEAIKKYYKSLSDNIKAVNAYLRDETFSTVLAPSNLAKDKPNYQNSRETIKKTKENVNMHLKEIDSLCDVKTIENLLDKEKLDDYEYYFDFYMQLMYTDKDKEDLQELRQQMDSVIKKLNEFLDKCDEILYFLEKNDNVVSYANNRIYLSSPSALNSYNKLIVELQAISNSFKTIGRVNDTTNNNSRNFEEA